MGYVHKVDARSELVPAVYAVLRGEQFVSSRSNSFGKPEEPKRPRCHEVRFCSDAAKVPFYCQPAAAVLSLKRCNSASDTANSAVPQFTRP